MRQAQRRGLSAAFFARANTNVGAVCLARAANCADSISEDGDIRLDLPTSCFLPHDHAAALPGGPPVTGEEEDVACERRQDGCARRPAADHEEDRHRNEAEDAEPLHLYRKDEEKKDLD